MLCLLHHIHLIGICIEPFAMRNASVSIEAKTQSIVNVQMCACTNHANTLCVFTVHC